MKIKNKKLGKNETLSYICNKKNSRKQFDKTKREKIKVETDFYKLSWKLSLRKIIEINVTYNLELSIFIRNFNIRKRNNNNNNLNK